MITRKQREEAVRETLAMLDGVGIALTRGERDNVEVADFGLSDLRNIGLQLVVYINTSRVCSKELVMTPWQTCPEHRHPAIGNIPGKEETFRCRSGIVYLYVEGEPNGVPKTQGLEAYAAYLAAAHEITLRPGEQYTLAPDTLHWFRAGAEGAIVSEFSTTSTDENDIFTDPRVARVTIVEPAAGAN